MIRYAMKCNNGHGFDSWFQSTAGYEKLRAAGLVTCAQCGSTQVEKSLMAPSLGTGRRNHGPDTSPSVSPHRPEAGGEEGAGAGSAAARSVANAPGHDGTRARPLSAPGSAAEAALAALKAHIEKTSDYVGMNFATEARSMHDGDAPLRPIHGEANPEEARRLIEDGIPVAPLPFLPIRKAN